MKENQITLPEKNSNHVHLKHTLLLIPRLIIDRVFNSLLHYVILNYSLSSHYIADALQSPLHVTLFISHAV